MLERVNTLPHVISENQLPDCPESITTDSTTKFKSTDPRCQCKVTLSKYSASTFIFNIEAQRQKVCLLHAGGSNITWTHPNDKKCVRHSYGMLNDVYRCGTHVCVKAGIDDNRLTEVQLKGTVNSWILF